MDISSYGDRSDVLLVIVLPTESILQKWADAHRTSSVLDEELQYTCMAHNSRSLSSTDLFRYRRTYDRERRRGGVSNRENSRRRSAEEVSIAEL